MAQSHPGTGTIGSSLFPFPSPSVPIHSTKPTVPLDVLNNPVVPPPVRIDYAENQARRLEVEEDEMRQAEVEERAKKDVKRKSQRKARIE